MRTVTCIVASERQFSRLGPGLIKPLPLDNPMMRAFTLGQLSRARCYESLPKTFTEPERGVLFTDDVSHEEARGMATVVKILKVIPENPERFLLI